MAIRLSAFSSRARFAAIGALALVGGAVIATTACAKPADTGPIKVGHYASMTGKEATFGQSTDNGIRLAVEEINAAGGVNGRPIEIITYDTKGESREAGAAVTRLITSDKVVAVLGEVASGLSLAGGSVAQQYGVPMITPSSTNPRVTTGRTMVSRVCFIDPFQGFVGAKFARETLKADKVAILYDQTAPYSKGLRDEFKLHFETMGGTIVSDQAYSGGDQDFSAQLTTIKATGPQAIYVPGYYTDVGNIALQARKLGIGKDVPLLGGDGWDSEQLAKIAGDAIEGSFYSNHYAPDQAAPVVVEFVSRYKARFDGATPDGLAALGYDAAKILAAAMTSTLDATGGLKGTDLAKAIADTKKYPGVTGVITIDKDRNAEKSAVVVEMKRDASGNLVPLFVTTIEPAGE